MKAGPWASGGCRRLEIRAGAEASLSLQEVRLRPAKRPYFPLPRAGRGWKGLAPGESAGRDCHAIAFRGNGSGQGKSRMCRRRAGSGTDCGWGGVPRKGRGAHRVPPFSARIIGGRNGGKPAGTERACRAAVACARRAGLLEAGSRRERPCWERVFYSSGLRAGGRGAALPGTEPGWNSRGLPSRAGGNSVRWAGGRKRAAQGRRCGCQRLPLCPWGRGVQIGVAQFRSEGYSGRRAAHIWRVSTSCSQSRRAGRDRGAAVVCRMERRCSLPGRTAGRQGYCRGGFGLLLPNEG